MSLRYIAGLVVVLVLISATAVRATPHRVVPPGQTAGSGAFSSVQEALSSGAVRDGDVILLAEGRHGFLDLDSFRFQTPVRIAAEQGAFAHVDGIKIQRSKNLVFEGLKVWPSRGGASDTALIQTGYGSEQIYFRGMEVRGHEDASSYPNWTRKDWTERKRSGAKLLGPSNEFADGTLIGVAFGIESYGENSRIVRNRIHGFSGDAIRANGSNTLVSQNMVRDCVSIDGNHDDGIQSWALNEQRRAGDGLQKNLRLEHNIIVEWSRPRRSNLTCELQGIGLFDGIYENLVIRGNTVVVSAWHGISGYGIAGGQIVDNVVFSPLGPAVERPWIGVFSYRNTASKNVRVENNVSPNYKTDRPGAVNFAPNVRQRQAPVGFLPSLYRTIADGP